jgi:putative ABC transport system substrate-binding protein
VTSLARPGGNITGLSLSAPDLSGKRLELLKQIVPGLSRVAVLWNFANPIIARQLRETEVAAQALETQLQTVGVRGPDDFDSAFRVVTMGRPSALVVLADFLTVGHRRRIAEFATKNRLPTISEFREFAAAGCLMAYGPSLPDLGRRAASYVDKILKGAKPDDLPVEQPTKFELVINLKTRQGARPHDPVVAAAAGGSGD